MFASYPLVIYPWWYLVIDTHWSFSDILIVLFVIVLSHREESKNLELSAQECRRDLVDHGCVRIDSRVIEEVESIEAMCGSLAESSREGIETKHQKT